MRFVLLICWIAIIASNHEIGAAYIACDPAFSQAFYRANENMLIKSKKHTAERNSWGFYGVTLKEFQKGGNQYDSYKI